MEYPNSKLTRKIRMAILLFYIVLFLVLCPIIILYARGYRYDWQYGFPKRTGAISVNVEPADTRVFLNNVEAKRSLNEEEVRLTSVPPGKYTVKITKSGYYDWIKDVEVKEMQTVYIKEIILMKKNDPVILDKGSVSTVVISPNNKYLAYAKNSGVNSQIWLKNLKDDSTQLILDFKDTSIKLVWDDNGEYLAISNARAPHNSLVVVPIENSDKKFDLVKLIKYPIDKFQWKKAIEPELFFSTKLKIMSLAPNTRRISTLSKNNFLDWSLENGQIWALINSTSSAKIEVIKDILGFKDTFYTLDGHPSGDNKQKLNINLAVRDNVLLSYPGGQTISLLRRNKNFVFGGQQTLISPYNNWWLIWSPWELWGYVEN